MSLQKEFDVVCKIASYWVKEYGLDAYSLTLAICMAPGGDIEGSRGMITKMIKTGRVPKQLSDEFIETQR